MHKALLLVPLLAAACSYPKFVASKTVDTDLPAAGLKTVRCETHNGGIVVRGAGTSETVRLRTEMSVRGHSQAEADDNLHLLSVLHETNGDEMLIRGEYPRGELANRSPSFRFTIEVPEHVALRLESHNADIETVGTRGALRAETHNGDVTATVDNPQVRVETHNGDVELTIGGDGPLDGQIETHNGSVTVSIGGEADAWLDIGTHNGGITPPDGIAEATIDRRNLRGRVGAGKGKLVIRSHNGNVVVR